MVDASRVILVAAVDVAQAVVAKTRAATAVIIGKRRGECRKSTESHDYCDNAFTEIHF